MSNAVITPDDPRTLYVEQYFCTHAEWAARDFDRLYWLDTREFHHAELGDAVEEARVWFAGCIRLGLVEGAEVQGPVQVIGTHTNPATINPEAWAGNTITAFATRDDKGVPSVLLMDVTTPIYTALRG